MAKKKAQAAVAATQSGFKKIETVTGTDVPTYYCNNVHIDISSFDVRFRLGQIQGASADGVLEVKDIAHVFMSHQHFTALVAAVNASAVKLAQMPVLKLAPAEDEKAH